MGKRSNAQREWQLLSNWLVAYHPHAEIHMNMRIGPTLPIGNVIPSTPALANLSRVRNRSTDTLYIENGIPTLVEASMESEPGIYSELIHYARLFRLDPNWTQFASVPVKLIALVARDDPQVALEAVFYNVAWVVYQPAFLTAKQSAPKNETANYSNLPLPQDWPARLDLLRIQKP
jgi:hypothetical protein